ncbi:Probable receptor-like protein kinase At1g80640, partial [Linum grandiflorum]
SQICRFAAAACQKEKLTNHTLFPFSQTTKVQIQKKLPPFLSSPFHFPSHRPQISPFFTNMMNLLPPLFLWSFFFLLIHGRPDAVFGPSSSLPPSNQPLPLLSPLPAAPSPDMGMAVRVVHSQDLNRRILIALIVASSLLGLILLTLSVIWIYWLITTKARNRPHKLEGGATGAKGHSLDPKKNSIVAMEYKLLEAATNSFHESNVLGEGCHGRVYAAHFDKRLSAAVKRLECRGQDVEREFENEVKWLTKFEHQNIISVLGHCTHDGTRFLVYEMMRNGSLESQLHGATNGAALTWHLRLKIAVDVARGLEYLHEHCNPPVVHRDIKASNILLDSDFNAKLSDFGLAVTSGNQNKNITLKGTLGYVAPEYLLHVVGYNGFSTWPST